MESVINDWPPIIKSQARVALPLSANDASTSPIPMKENRRDKIPGTVEGTISGYRLIYNPPIKMITNTAVAGFFDRNCIFFPNHLKGSHKNLYNHRSSFHSWTESMYTEFFSLRHADGLNSTFFGI